jgi:hypothetical protein
VLFVDAHDVLIVRPREAIEAAFLALGQRAVASTEKLCYPDPWKESYYPEAASPWRFLNSGGILGEAETLLELFSDYGHLVHDTCDDQRWWTDCFLADRILAKRQRIALDTHCEIFQSAWNSLDALQLGQDVENSRTRTLPGVIHGNGGVDLDPIVAWLEAKRRCRRSPQALPSGRISIARR